MDPEQRFDSISGQYPDQMELLLVLEEDMERELHSRFAGDRVHGEWFKLTPELSQFILSKGGDFAHPVRVRTEGKHAAPKGRFAKYGPIVGFRPSKEELAKFRQLQDLHPDLSISDLVRGALEDRFAKELTPPKRPDPVLERLLANI